MSLNASTWAWKQRLTPGAKFVLLALAEHAHKDGSGAYPSVATIAVDTRISKRAVQYALRSLEQDGVIARGDQSMSSHLGRYAPTVYDLALQGTFITEVKDATPAPLRGATRGAKNDRLGVQQVHPNQKINQLQKEGAVSETSHQRARDEKPPLQYLDKHGPLTPRCDRHATATDNPPCRACALIRPEFERAHHLRRGEQDRIKAAAIRVVRDAHVGTPPPPAIAAAKAALRRAGSHRAIDDDRRRRVEFVA